MATLTITIRDEDRRFIENAVSAGQYVSESEAVSDAIAELRAREELRNVRVGELRAKISLGLAELDRGEGVEWDLENVKRKGRAALGLPESRA